MSSKRVICVGVGGEGKKTLDPQFIRDVYDYKYPSEQAGKKPEIEVSECLDISKAFTSVKEKFNTGVVNLQDALAFLTEALKLLRATLTDDWISYKIKIGAKDDVITPLSLLEVKYSQKQCDFDHTGNVVVANESQIITLAALLCAVYRLGKIKTASTGNYRQTLAERIESMLTMPPFTNIITTGVLFTTANGLSPWVNNATFRKLVGAVDMFFMRFEHPYSVMRVGTVVTAYEDCSALSSLTYFVNKLGLTPEESVLYFFHPSIVKDLERIWKPDQEIEVPNSYFVHFKALGFSGKSPYSSSAAGYLYNCIHFTGSYLGDPRSLNAAVITDKAPNEMIVLAAFLGEAFWGTATYSRHLFADDEDLAEHQRTVAAAEDFDDAGSMNNASIQDSQSQGTPRTPQAVYNRIVSERGTMTADQKRRFQEVVRRINQRPGSFAEFIANLVSMT